MHSTDRITSYNVCYTKLLRIWKHHGRINHYPGGFLSDIQPCPATAVKRFFWHICRYHTGVCFYHAHDRIHFSAGEVKHGI